MMGCGEDVSTSYYEYDTNLSGSSAWTRRGISPCLGFSGCEIFLLLIVTVQISSGIIITILDVDYLLQCEANELTSLIVNGIILFLLGTAAIHFAHGLFWENQQELCLLCWVLLASTLFVALDFAFNHEFNPFQHSKMIRLCLFLICTPIVCTFAKFSSSNFSQFHIPGASDALIKMYRNACFLLAYLKLDLELSIILGSLNLSYSYHFDKSYLVTIFIIIYSILLYIIGRRAITKENKTLVFIFVSLCTLGILWIPFQIMSLSCFLGSESCTSETLLMSYCCVSTSLLLIINRIYVYILLMKAYRNFGYGLTDRAFLTLLTSETTSLLSGPRSRSMNL